jgi:hypothetical protein
MSEREPLLPTTHHQWQPNGGQQPPQHQTGSASSRNDGLGEFTLVTLARFAGALRAGKLPTTEQFVRIDQKLLQSNVLNANQVCFFFVAVSFWEYEFDLEVWL